MRHLTRLYVGSAFIAVDVILWGLAWTLASRIPTATAWDAVGPGLGAAVSGLLAFLLLASFAWVLGGILERKP